MRGGKEGIDWLRDLDPFVVEEAPHAAQEQRAYPRRLQILRTERGVRRFHRARCACIKIWPDTPGSSENRSYPETGWEEINGDLPETALWPGIVSDLRGHDRQTKGAVERAGLLKTIESGRTA
jgi:hypothetical protein